MEVFYFEGYTYKVFKIGKTRIGFYSNRTAIQLWKVR